MGFFIFLPLVLPLTAWPVARLAEQRLHPNVATRLLTGVAVVMAACSTLCLALLMVVGTAQLPGNPLPDGWSDPQVREAVPYEEIAGKAAIPVLLVVAAGCWRTLARHRRVRRQAHRALEGLPGTGVVVLEDTVPYAYALPGGRGSGALPGDRAEQRLARHRIARHRVAKHHVAKYGGAKSRTAAGGSVKNRTAAGGGAKNRTAAGGSAKNRTARRGSAKNRIADAAAAENRVAPKDRIVVTAGLLSCLDAPERRALFAHERAHLVARHHRHLLAVQLAARANPFLRPLRTAVAYTAERWADEEAAHAVGDRRAVALAIGKAALVSQGAPAPTLAGLAAPGPVPRRVAALLAPAPGPRSWPSLFTSVGLAAWTAAAGTLASAMSSANSTVTLVLILHAATPL
ncbi:M48 family metalloprotease [Streptomyces sp. p1417]|uniref:M48 family metalloprotease n=1 Tax=Streptomyces typhae TaxID=2681492 RepID=A0A6L6X517_9ACTN|nr:M56 family metallopeptidase [Streptomyces typhae]MVO88629.1 M48 family metalloprotease [Streptomyces typhae]